MSGSTREGVLGWQRSEVSEAVNIGGVRGVYNVSQPRKTRMGKQVCRSLRGHTRFVHCGKDCQGSFFDMSSEEYLNCGVALRPIISPCARAWNVAACVMIGVGKHAAAPQGKVKYLFLSGVAKFK